MQIQRVQNNNTNFKGYFPIKDANYYRLVNSLNPEERALFKNIVQAIKKSDDGNRWGFSYFTLYSNAQKYAGISLIGLDGLPYRPAKFMIPVKKDADALELFKSLHKWYKNNVKGFNGINIDDYKA